MRTIEMFLFTYAVYLVRCRSHSTYLITHYVYDYIDQHSHSKRDNKIMSASIKREFLDLNRQSEEFEKATLLQNATDILQTCRVEGHRCENCTEYDQVMSAVACILRTAPVIIRVNCPVIDHC